MQQQKRALAIHDISCIGKCSLTVALPILSAAGIETAVLPTSVLSTHTGGFTGYTFRDLTEDILPIADHWSTLDLHFDAIYTGYLGSRQQLQLIAELFDRFSGPDTLLLVDPVMADHGRLYPGFDRDFPSGMAALCRRADVVVPNFTEAALLLGEPYVPGPYTTAYVTGLLHRLGETFDSKVVLTGIQPDEKELGAASFDPNTGEISYALNHLIPGYFHGTGDIFASGLLAALMNGFSLGHATEQAANFTVAAIEQTEPDRDAKYGVCFERALPGLMQKLDRC